MTKKNGKKKSWKERLRERQIKYQRALQAHKIKMEKKLVKKKSGKWRGSKIILPACLFAIILIVYAAGQYPKPSTTTHVPESPSQQTPEPQSGFIYIWPDGRIEPKTTPITKVRENYYKFTGNVTLPIIVLMDNIVIDGAGYFLKGNGITGSKGIDLSYRQNVTVTNLKIEGFDYGVYLNSTTKSTVSDNIFKNNYGDIWLKASPYNKITSNNILKKEGYGIWLSNSTGNFITKNTIMENVNSTAIYLKFSENNTIYYNTLANNRLGIFLYSSQNNKISHNKITQNHEGIHLLNSTRNLITLNNITKNDIGIGLDESSNNTIYHNNFIDNTVQVSVQNSTNIWDNSKEGNHWSNYKGADTNKDGIGDEPYIINDTNQDRYPLIKPKS